MSFLEYTGHYTHKQKYRYKMQKGKFDTYSVSKYCAKVINPTFDNSFKRVFFDKSILKNILNNILYPKSKKIDKVELYTTTFPGLNEIRNRYGFGTKNIDVGVFCKLKKNLLNKNEDSEIVIDLEMQIGISNKITQRFIDYAAKIRIESDYKKVLVIGFILKENLKEGKNNTSIIDFNKYNLTKEKFVREYDCMKIIEIDLNACYSLIKRGEELIINDENGEEINESGKEWIKFLSMPFWCESDEFNKDIFIMPNYDTKNNFFVNSCVKKAFDILSKKKVIFLINQELMKNIQEKKEKNMKK